MKKSISTTLMIAMLTELAFSQNLSKTAGGSTKKSAPDYNFSVSTPWLTFVNFGPEKTNTHHLSHYLTANHISL